MSLIFRLYVAKLFVLLIIFTIFCLKNLVALIFFIWRFAYTCITLCIGCPSFLVIHLCQIFLFLLLIYFLMRNSFDIIGMSPCDSSSLLIWSEMQKINYFFTLFFFTLSQISTWCRWWWVCNVWGWFRVCWSKSGYLCLRLRFARLLCAANAGSDILRWSAGQSFCRVLHIVRQIKFP